MRRIMLTIAYDGTRFHGYQIQDNADTIEGRLKEAIDKLTGEDCELIGGSRTDAGVHALCNVAVFDTASSIKAEKFSYALNSKLVPAIRVVSSKEVRADFHPRHCDSVKTYEYSIYCAEFPDPLRRMYQLFTYTALDTDAMRRAAAFMVGEHDFSSFCAAGAQVDSKVRTIYSCEVLLRHLDNAEEDFAKEEPRDKGSLGLINPRNGEKAEIVIRVSGNGFLYNMVRIIAGTLLEVGRGAILPESIPQIIDSMDRRNAGPTAPAVGLVLKDYKFL